MNRWKTPSLQDSFPSPAGFIFSIPSQFDTYLSWLKPGGDFKTTLILDLSAVEVKRINQAISRIFSLNSVIWFIQSVQFQVTLCEICRFVLLYVQILFLADAATFLSVKHLSIKCFFFVRALTITGHARIATKHCSATWYGPVIHMLIAEDGVV